MLFYSVNLLSVPCRKLSGGLGFSHWGPKFVDLVCDFLLTRTLNHFPFGMNGCKSRFIGTLSNVLANVYRCLTSNWLSIITPFFEKNCSKKKLDKAHYKYVE